jgi:hypothetical protein
MNRRSFIAAFVGAVASFAAGLLFWRKRESLSERLEKIVKPLPLHRFRLIEDLRAGGMAAAFTRHWDGERYIDGNRITASDCNRETQMFSACEGAEGWAVKKKSGTYDIVWIEVSCRTVEFTLHSPGHIDHFGGNLDAMGGLGPPGAT